MSKVKDEVEDMFFYLAWLEKTSSNFITIDSGNEGSEDDDTQNVDDKSNTTETTTSDADNHAASNFRPTKKPKLQTKRKSAGKKSGYCKRRSASSAVDRKKTWAEANTRLQR